MSSCRARMVLAALLFASGSCVAKASDLLPLGDGKISYTVPRVGYIYVCDSNPPPPDGGAFADGPWIEGKVWDPSKKIHVQGRVKWPTASVSFEVSGDQRVVKANDLPPHPTGIFPIRPDDPAFEYDRNPNSIEAENVMYSIPANPVAASSPGCLRGGPIGIALTGVAVFNGLDAEMRDAVAHEIQDAYGGHPQERDVYHYHNISNAVAKFGVADSLGNTLMGYAFDGFGIYGPIENGRTLTTADLDECHGHVSRIVWDGVEREMYHYVATADYPYTLGCYRGTPVHVMPPRGALNSLWRSIGSAVRGQ